MKIKEMKLIADSFVIFIAHQLLFKVFSAEEIIQCGIEKNIKY